MQAQQHRDRSQDGTSEGAASGHRAARPDRSSAPSAASDACLPPEAAVAAVAVTSETMQVWRDATDQLRELEHDHIHLPTDPAVTTQGGAQVLGLHAHVYLPLVLSHILLFSHFAKPVCSHLQEVLRIIHSSSCRHVPSLNVLC